MPATAKIGWNYRWRLGVLGLMFTLWGVWSIWDGAIAYPEQNRKHEAYTELHDEGNNPRFAEQWTELSEEKGWDPEDHGKPHSEFDLAVQFVMAGVTGPIGLIFLGSFFMSFGRWVESTDGKLLANGGREVDYDHITALDKARWKTKGIAVVRYPEGKITLDDWKFDREATEVILRDIEENINHSKIENGEPEPPVEEEDEGEESPQVGSPAEDEQQRVE